MKWTLHTVERFDDFAAAWDRINNAAGGLPFLRSNFIRSLLQHFRNGGERLAVLGAPGQERALCIVSSKRPAVWETYQPSQLPLGAWVMEPNLRHVDLLSSLLRALPGFPLLLAATQQDPFVHERPAAAATLRTLDYIQTGWIEVRNSFDEYWKSCSKQLQQNMRTQRSRLAREGTRGTLEVLTRPEQVAEAVADFGRLESAGWKGAQGTAVTADNEQGRFYRAVLEDFCRLGAARIYRYRFGDRVVAVDLCIESADVQVLLKTTYDESIKGLSPSSLLREEAYRQLFDEGRIRRIEFYGRVMEWTTRWTDCRRTLYHVNGYRWGIVPIAVARFAELRSALRRRAVAATPAN
jgi:CelD/BcsL family acetyltransferase involved in cellulose biosynthesis